MPTYLKAKAAMREKHMCIACANMDACELTCTFVPAEVWLCFW